MAARRACLSAAGRLLDTMAAHGQIAIAAAEIAADLFLKLVHGRSWKQAPSGIAIDPTAQERRRRATVALVRAGCRPDSSLGGSSRGGSVTGRG